MTIEEFREKFAEIKKRGYIKSLRKGPTGIGYTLETLLEINENNNKNSDIEGAELKSHRTGVNNMVTLFTFNKKAWQIPQLEAIDKYGSYDKKGRKGLYYTMSLTPNSAGLFLVVSEKEVSVRHISGEVIATWQLENIAERFINKIPSLILVSALTEERDGCEYFHYNRAQIMRGTSVDLLSNQFKEGNILVDLRLHDNGTRARNHGTGFRVYENRLDKLFNKIEDL